MAPPPRDISGDRFNRNRLNTRDEISSVLDMRQQGTAAERPPVSMPVTPNVSRFKNDASILLLGMPGAGKKTLGMMASMVLRRRYVDFNVFFERHMGVAPAEHLAQHGLAAHREAEVVVTDALLKECRQNHVIGGLSELGTSGQRALLQTFAKTNPVVYVLRAKEQLRRFMAAEQDEFDQWYRFRNAFYRSCSNLDFYSITNAPRNSTCSNVTDTLKLKDTETDFLRFLHRIFGHPPQLLHSADPFSSSYTYALEVPLTWLEAHSDYEDLECGADAINLVIDISNCGTDLQDKVMKQMAILRRHTRVPIILDVRYPSTNPSAYFAALKLGARTLPDTLTIDLTADASQLKAFAHDMSQIDIIGTYHQEAPWWPDTNQTSWLKLQAMSQMLSCRALRISHHPTALSENLECIHFVQEEAKRCETPVIAYNTGTLGRTSVCFNPVLSPVTLPSVPGSNITLKQAQSALYSCFFLKSKRFKIFGKSVSYSLSPAMHNAAYLACGMPHSYHFYESNEFSNIRHLLEEEDCGGLAISLPFKTDVLPLLQSISPEAKDIGAVNTIVVSRSQHADGSQDILLKGFNTDHIGIRECIYRHLSPANSIRESTSALIIGAGGMARAAVYACHTLCVKNICVYNRNVETAEKLAQHCTWSASRICLLKRLDEEWPAHLRQPTIIVSTIPAHTIDGRVAHELDIPEQWLRSRTGGVFIELAYKPIITRFVQQMQSMSSRGWITVDGLNVLVAQGVAQFEILTGRPAPVHVMRRAVQTQYELVGL